MQDKESITLTYNARVIRWSADSLYYNTFVVFMSILIFIYMKSNGWMVSGKPII